MSLLENSLNLVLENNSIAQSKFLNYLVSHLQDSSIRSYKKNIKLRTQYVLNICDILIKNNALLAGGSVLGAFSNFKIEDMDFYVNQKDALSMYTDLVKIGYYKIDEQCIAPAYDQSFFRKNHILSRFRLEHDTFIPVDLMIISDKIKLIDVVTNFDLSFCEIWFNGQNVYAVDPEGIKNKTGMLKPEYSEALFKYFNKFITKRIKKYGSRGFKISYTNPYSSRCFFLYNHSEIKTISDPEEWVVKHVLSKFYKINCKKDFNIYYHFTLKEFTVKELFAMLKRYYHITPQSYGAYTYISSDLQSIPMPIEYRWRNETEGYFEDASPEFKKRRVDMKVKLLIKYFILTTFGQPIKVNNEDEDEDERKDWYLKWNEKWIQYINKILNSDIDGDDDDRIINDENFYVDFQDYTKDALSTIQRKLLTDILFVENILEPRERTGRYILDEDHPDYIEGEETFVTLTKINNDIKTYEVKNFLDNYFKIINQRSEISYYKNNYLIPNDFEILDMIDFEDITMNSFLNKDRDNHIIFLYDSDQSNAINGIKGLGLSKVAIYQLYSKLVVECKKAKDSLRIYKKDVLLDKIYNILTVGDSLNNGILLSKLNCVKDEIEKENGKRIFYLTEKRLLNVISGLSSIIYYDDYRLNIHGSTRNLVSATHCGGEGQQTYVYDDIYIINENTLVDRKKFTKVIKSGDIPSDEIISETNKDKEEILTKISKFISTFKEGVTDSKTLSKLLTAIKSEKTEKALDIINNTTDINYLNNQDEDEYKNTALLYAVDRKNIAIVKKLLEKGVNVNLKNFRNSTALIIAAYGNDIEILRILLENGADINAVNINGNTALIIAAESGYKTIVEELIAADADLNVINNRGMTALIEAAANEDKEIIVRELISAGADVNIKSKDYGWTALMIACENGNKIIVRELIAAGADVNIRNNNFGSNALTIAVRDDNNEDIVRQLIAAGADLEIREENYGNMTALEIAIYKRNKNMIRILQEAGAIGSDIEDSENEEEDSDSEDSEDSEEEEDLDPLITAAKNGDTDTVWNLISENNVSYDTITDNNGMNALMWASKNGHINVVQQLIRVGADPNLGDNNAETALMYAILSDNKDLIKYLLDSGADINLRDDDDYTAMDHARVYGSDDEILDLLREYSNRQTDDDSGEYYYDGKSINEKLSPKRR